jgi:glyoxylate/hydroxypyruvate reductase A
LNLWAGVEDVVKNKTLKAPLARMVDEGLTQGMKEWVLGHVMRHHLGTDLHIFGKTENGEIGQYPRLQKTEP